MATAENPISRPPETDFPCAKVAGGLCCDLHQAGSSTPKKPHIKQVESCNSQIMVCGYGFSCFCLLSPAWVVHSSWFHIFRGCFCSMLCSPWLHVYDFLLHQTNPFNFCIFTQKQGIVPVLPYPTREQKSKLHTWVRTGISAQIWVWLDLALHSLLFTSL